MPRNSSDALVIEQRRAEIAHLRRRRLTVRQIAQALEDSHFLNPRTAKPWGVATVQRDLDHLHAAARAESLRDISDHRAEILSDYHALLDRHWAVGNYDEVRRVLKDVRDMLGTDAPQVIVYEQMEARMSAALDALEQEFADDPATRERALRALLGGDGGRPAAALPN